MYFKKALLFVYIVPGDYEMLMRTVTFTSGVTRIEVPVTIIDDVETETTEDFLVNVTVADSDFDINIAPGQTAVVIIDDDGKIFAYFVLCIAYEMLAIYTCLYSGV